MGEFINSTWGQVPALWQAVIWSLIKVIMVLIPLVLTVAYYTYAERKVIGAAQSRMGPNVVGYRGLLQPFADVLKLLLKEVIRPAPSDRYLFFVAPVLAFAPAIAAWAIIPFGPGLVIANINVAVLYFLAMTSLGVYGIILAGWASNSKYAFLGSMRSAAQVVSYELGMSFCLVGVIMASGSMNLGEIVRAQQGNFFTWYWLPLLPLFVIYFVSGVAETNRAPFDLAEGESELVAGFHVEYSGMAFALFFLAEYANMILISALASVMFMGGWLSPFQDVPALGPAFAWVPPIIWMLLKTGFFMFCFLWFRATFPRYRYDQIMRLGWKVFIPLTLVWLVVESFMILGHLGPWFA